MGACCSSGGGAPPASNTVHILQYMTFKDEGKYFNAMALMEEDKVKGMWEELQKNYGLKSCRVIKTETGENPQCCIHIVYADKDKYAEQEAEIAEKRNAVMEDMKEWLTGPPERIVVPELHMVKGPVAKLEPKPDGAFFDSDVKASYDEFDASETGHLSRSEFKKALAELEIQMDAVEMNKLLPDGKIDFEEYKTSIRAKATVVKNPYVRMVTVPAPDGKMDEVVEHIKSYEEEIRTLGGMVDLYAMKKDDNTILVYVTYESMDALEAAAPVPKKMIGAAKEKGLLGGAPELKAGAITWRLNL